MKKIVINRPSLWLVVGLLVLSLVVGGVLWTWLKEPGEVTLAELRRQGELIILTRNAPTIYYEGREGLEGPEYDLASAFAQFLGMRTRFVVLDGVAQILDAIRTGEGHLAAAGLTRTEPREQDFLFGPDYRAVQQQLVCHRDGPRLQSLEDLGQMNITVIRASSYEENLTRLKEEISELDWQVTDELGTEELLAQVWERKLDCTIADSNIVAINRRYYPELEVAFAMSEEQPLAWIVSPQAKALLPALEDWLEQMEATGELAVIEERYYGHVDIFDYVDMRAYARRIESRLPKFLPVFRKAAEKQDFPWTLLAAMAYQESHWNPKARSPTGVRGLMMLTSRTAKEVDVKNRLDPVQSIRGGALYLRRLLERIPESVTGEDRLWFALAAYNVGFGHLLDARKLAVKLDKNPDLWLDVKEVLPLLARKKYYRTLKYGYARGSEPVRYVQRIRDFQDVLEQRVTLLGETRPSG